MDTPTGAIGLAALWLGVLGAACVVVDADGERLEHQIEDAQRELDGLRAQVDGHHAQAGQAADLPGLQAIEGLHHDEAGAHLDDLDHVIGDMYMCELDDEGLLDHMDAMQEACGSELDRHRDTIATVDDLDAAMAEEDRHHAAMLEWLDDVDHTVGELTDADADEMCHGHHGMHDHQDG